MSRISAFIPMDIPTVTHNDLMPIKGKGGKLKIVKTPELHDAEAKWEAHLASAIPKGQAPLRGPLTMELRICFRSKGKHHSGDPHITKPDLDNMEKTLGDVLQRIDAIADDCMIFDKRVSKMWNEIPGVYIKIEELVL